MTPSRTPSFTFGIVRTYPFQPPCLQFFRAEHTYESRRVRISPSSHEITDVRCLPPDFADTVNPAVSLSRISYDTRVSTLWYRHPETHQAQEVYFWTLPLRVTSYQTGQQIPILEFQIRSWLPHQTATLPLEIPAHRILDMLQEVNRERLAEIRRLEDEEREIPWHRPPSTRLGVGRDDWDDRVRTPPLLSPVIRTEPTVIERVIERVVVQPQPLPKSVGEVLLANARKGTETCPITATPFSECEQLSVTSCFHIFETESLSRWQQTHSTCPVCRTTFQNIVSETA